MRLQGECPDCGSDNAKLGTRHNESSSLTTKGKYECRDCGEGWWE